MKKYLAITEVSKKQGYIFQTNKLKENIGASTIIEYVTEHLPNGISNEIIKGSSKNQSTNDNNCLYQGGGNSIYEFDNKEDVLKFTNKVSSEILKEFPGIQFFTTIKEYDNEKDYIDDAINELFKKIGKKKEQRKANFIRQSYGIEEVCKYTKKPASYYENKEGFLSKESKIKQKWASEKKIDAEYGMKTSIRMLKTNIESSKEYIFSSDFEDMGVIKDKDSYIAIVTLDGNRMGTRLEALRENLKFDKLQLSIQKYNFKYGQSLTEFSKNIKLFYKNAFMDVLKSIDLNIDVLEEKLKINKDEETHKLILPIRPIILAGDDVCFVCNASIAMECAKIFMKSLSENFMDAMGPEGVKSERLNACAGIAMVQKNYPFNKAHQISEGLCQSCKEKLLGINQNKEKYEDHSMLDFHICQGEITTSLPEIKEKIIKNKNVDLHVKPLFIDTNNDFSSYNLFCEEIERINKLSEEKHSKIRLLRDIIPYGKDKTKIFMNKYRLEKDFCFDGKGNKGYAKKNVDNSFSGEKNVYFNILEVHDKFIKLED